MVLFIVNCALENPLAFNVTDPTSKCVFRMNIGIVFCFSFNFLFSVLFNYSLLSVLSFVWLHYLSSFAFFSLVYQITNPPTTAYEGYL